MIVRSQTDANDTEQMLVFYKNTFHSVEVVTCGSCGVFLAFEVAGSKNGDNMGLQPNELGKFVIPIGEALLSHRVRLDETTDGHRMVGYQCGNLVPNPAYPAKLKEHESELAQYDKEHAKAVKKAKKDETAEPPYEPPAFTIPEHIECGNDTRISNEERGMVPTGGFQSSLSPFEKDKIRREIKANRKSRPNFRKVGLVKHFETFQVEKIQ